jgi:hypothetical protein
MVAKIPELSAAELRLLLSNLHKKSRGTLCRMVKVRAAPQADGWLCEVSVEHGGERSEYTVAVSPQDLARWGQGAGPEAVEDLVARSFAFLLEREPPSSILRRFDLSVVRRYFPEYDQQFKR